MYSPVNRLYHPLKERMSGRVSDKGMKIMKRILRPAYRITAFLCAVLLLCGCSGHVDDGDGTGDGPSYLPVSTAEEDLSAVLSEQMTAEPAVTAINPELSSASSTEEAEALPIMHGTLFVGDSRTVGLQASGVLEGAAFFAVNGMSVYNVPKQTVDVFGDGELSLDTLLTDYTFDTIYVMLGVNELGYDHNATVSRYREFVADIAAHQPEAEIILQANLRVTRAHSAEDEIINNSAINRFNKTVKALAEEMEYGYLDPNRLFDDGYGNLSPDYTSDGVHIFDNHSGDWAEWILKKAGKEINRETEQ